MVGSASLLHGGHGWSQPSKTQSSNSENKNVPDQYEPYKREFATYLEKIKLDGITTKRALMEHLQTAVNKDIRDATKFPLLHTFIELQSDEKKAHEVNIVIKEATKKFIETKVASLKLIDEEKDEYEEVDNTN
jgi:hypothetical protein